MSLKSIDKTFENKKAIEMTLDKKKKKKKDKKHKKETKKHKKHKIKKSFEELEKESIQLDNLFLTLREDLITPNQN